MPSLVTQSLSEKPLVILIADDSFVSESVKNIFISNDLAVTQIRPDDFQHVYFLDLIQTRKSLYKIIWISGFTPQNTQKNERILRSLVEVNALFLEQNKQTVPIVCIGKITTDFTTSAPFYSGFKEHLQSEKNITQKILTQLPSAQCIFGQDVIAEEKNIHFPFRFFVEGIQKQLLLDPQADVYFQTPQSFFELLYPQLVKPHTSQVFVIRGKEKKSTFWVEKIQELYRQYFSLQLEKITVASESHHLQLTNNEVIEATSSYQDLEGFFDEKIRSLPSSIQENSLGKYFSEDVHKTFLVGNSKTLKSSLPEPQNEVRVKLEKKRFSSPQPVQENNSPQLLDLLDTAELENNRFLQKKIVKNKIHQSKNSNLPQNPLITEENEVVKKEGEVEKDLQRIFGQKRSSVKGEKVVAQTKSKKKILQKSKRKKTMFYGGVGIIGMGLGVGLLIFVFQVGVYFLKKDLFSFIQSYQGREQTIQSSQETELTSKWYSFLDAQVTYYSYILDESFFDTASPLIETVSEVQELASSSQEAKKTTLALYQSVMGRGEATQNTLADLGESSQALFEKLSQIQTKISVLDTADFSEDEKQKIEEFENDISEKRQKLSVYTQLQSFLSPFLGMQGKRVYAVLVQNNLELRPTGGFVQSVALLTFDKGLLIDTQVMSVYDIDDKLLSAVTPPDEIKKVLGEEKWYLRDSNWDADFPTTAQNVSWFLKESVGITVDGVIALDYNVLADLIGASGDLSLPEYNEVLTQKNLLERVEYHAKDDLSQDSVAGKKYSEKIVQSLLTQLQNLPNENVVPVMSVLRTSLDEKNLMISLPKKQENGVLEELGWDGRIIQPECPGQFDGEVCIIDTLYQVEANVGINKVNAYVEREVHHEVTISQEKIQHNRVITYKNTAKSDNWPQGKYRTYIRFYVKNSAQLDSLMLDGKKVDTNLVTAYKDKDKQVFGMLLEVPRGKETTLVVSYSEKNEAIAKMKAEDTKFSYVFFDQKQPGWENDSLDIVFKHGTDLAPKVIAPQAEVIGNSIDFQVDRSGHAFVGAEFQMQ